MTIGRLANCCALICCGLIGCSQEVAEPDVTTDSPHLEVAEIFVSAFYSWDATLLAAQIRPGEDADRVLYYQGWAEAARYAVQQRRPCTAIELNEVECAVTVTDDFGQTLGYTATDTFTLIFEDDQIAQVSFVGDDPPIFDELFAWLGEHQPDIFAGPCKDLFDGGETPADCARAVVQGAKDFMAQRAG
jgi:hypothetical protein